MATDNLTLGFLSQPGPKPEVTVMDFSKSILPEYAGLYAVIIENVLTAEECHQLVHIAEAQTDGKWEPAMVNVGGGMQDMRLDARDCGRIILDDKDLVARIWSRVKDHVPEVEYLKGVPRITGNGPTKREETWRMSRLNERMRFLKYGKGQYFRPHADGSYITPDRQEMSFYTLHLYLNESDPNSPDGKLEGGSTTFHSWDMQRALDVEPKIGRVLLFQHRGLLHSGDDVLAGTKLTLRTDLMYRKVDSQPEEDVGH